MTAYETFSNNATTTVTSGGTTAPAGGTSESWTVASSASFPAAATGVSQFHVADADATSEKILVTNVSGTTWTVTRGAESTTPVVHAAGFTVNQVVTAGVLGTFPQSVTAADTSVVIAGSAAALTVRTGTLDVIAADHPAAADWSNNSHKITSLANGSGAQDAAAFGQTPAGGNTATIGQGGTGQVTASAALNALGGAAVAGDIGGTSASPQVTGTHLASALPVAQGGSGTTLQTPGIAPQYPLVMAPVAWCLANTDSGVGQKPLTSYTYANGTAGVGATITHNVNGVLAVDGGSPAVNDRVLVLDPYAGGTGSPPHPDGIYTVTSAGSAGSAWVLTRAADNNTAAKLGQFWAVAITGGTLFGGGWAAVQALSDVSGAQSFVVGTSFIGFSVASESAFCSGPWSTAGGTSAAALGTQATAYGNNSVAVGNTATAQGTGAHGYGPYSQANGQYSVTLGYQSYANNLQSVAVGPFSVAYTAGQVSEASNYNNLQGDAQSCRFYPIQTTTNATPANLIGPLSRQLKFQDRNQNDDFGKTVYLVFTAVARRTDSVGNDAVFTASGALFGNGSNAYAWNGATPPAFTKAVSNGTTTGWAVAASVSSNTVSVTVTGAVGQTIDWVCKVETIEVA